MVATAAGEHPSGLVGDVLAGVRPRLQLDAAVRADGQHLHQQLHEGLRVPQVDFLKESLNKGFVGGEVVDVEAVGLGQGAGLQEHQAQRVDV